MSNGRRGHQKKIDTVHWTYGSFVFAGQAAGTAAVNVLAAQHLPETLLRIRGEWIACIDQATAPSVGTSVTIGLILVPEGTGTTVLWSPITDGDAPWIWWDAMHIVYEEMVNDVVAAQAALSGRRVIDSKAMRKVRNTELQCVVESATIGGFGATAVHATGSVRVLAGS